MPEVTPGNETSEFSLTKFQLWAGTALVVVGALVDLVPALQELHPGAPWLGSTLVALGVIKNVLSLFAYTKSRTLVKAAASQSEALKAAVPTSAPAP